MASGAKAKGVGLRGIAWGGAHPHGLLGLVCGLVCVVPTRGV
jgi:hypothetical protein